MGDWAGTAGFGIFVTICIVFELLVEHVFELEFADHHDNGFEDRSRMVGDFLLIVGLRMGKFISNVIESSIRMGTFLNDVMDFEGH